MENFIVSARKYRPQDFKSVVGQQSITSTLKNAVKTKQLAHAYLFCGPRGVGKTTCARIFAKTINCSNPTDDFEACNECESCKAFNENRSYNIHELDAASNNSVEDIRNLIEQVRIPPQIGTHSVYIIDEVHMLSSQAFNAFLKTLEEPPEYAIFVLATTEKHKILPTILSRCQIFDFNRIKVEDATEYLAYVAEQEGIEAEKDALNIIARKADGAMRDALSFFDRIVSFSGKKITYKDTIENLNVLDYDYYFKLTEFILEGNISEALLIFDEISDKGFDGHRFIAGLSSHFRDITVCKDPETVKLLETGSNIKEKYLKQARETDIAFLLKALDIANQTDITYKAAQNKRLQVELALMKMCDIATENKKKTEIPKSAESKIVNEEKKEPAGNKKITDKKNGPSLSGSRISIKGAVNKKEYSEQNTEDVTEEISGEDRMTIEEAWQLLLSKLSDKPRLYNALKNENLTVADENTVVLNVVNKSLEQYLITIKSRITNILRKATANNKLEIHFKISEDENTGKSEYIYTDRDKYKYLVSKNPNLEKLKNDFDLDY
ncbi:MAG: DNA polymerase III subunit gamma/tau [Chlorobi bacterium]|nr:DNA polymerase III subunit gamma/tau [Chlorobiota bacterium]